MIDRVINLSQWIGVHIYSLDNLASHGIPNLLKKKYLKKKILRYMDSNFSYIESLLMKLPQFARAIILDFSFLCGSLI